MKPLFLTIIGPIAAIFSCRMLGLFMLIPVFTIYASHLEGATPTRIGIALGSYGLSQGLLQIPFGILSDKFGRKPILTFGLILFAIGSLLGAMTHSIQGMIIARAIQGMGAIGSVLIALLADLTSDKQRTLAMAFIGASIGLSFGVAFIISPIITSFGGLSGIFYFTVLLVMLALTLLHAVIPTPVTLNTPFLPKSTLQRLKLIVYNGNLMSLNLGIFCQHFILTSMFYIVPMQLEGLIQEGLIQSSWYFYLPILFLSFLAMVPVIYISEKRKKSHFVFITCIVTTLFSQLGLLFGLFSSIAFSALVFFYFIAFNILEAQLPSMISKQAESANKGTAMGVYSSCQFLGIFAGGTSAGFVYQTHGSQGIFIVNVVIAIFWIIISWRVVKNKVTNCS
jgi:MFS family permease